MPPGDLATCHRDLWADNVLPTRAGLCVIDWDNSGLADRSQELALVLFEFGADDPERTRTSTAATSRQAAPVACRAPGLLAGDRPDRPHRRMGIAAWLAPETPAAERERWVPRIEEFLSLVLTRPVIDGILAALGRLAGLHRARVVGVAHGVEPVGRADRDREVQQVAAGRGAVPVLLARRDVRGVAGLERRAVPSRDCSRPSPASTCSTCADLVACASASARPARRTRC